MANVSGVPASCYVAEAGDPDVAGLGVIAASLTSISATVATILLLYVWGGLPHKQYNQIDRILIRFIPKPSVDPDEERDSERKRMHTAVKETLVDLLLNLSDQQLLLGLTLVLTIYIRMSDLNAFSAYSFKISTTSVWLSCLTHLATVVALRGRFPTRGGRRGWRVAAMVVLLVFLAPILLISNFPTFLFEPSLSFRCAWDQISTYNREKTWNFALLASSAVIMTVGGYGSKIVQLYQPIRRHGRLREGWKDKMARHISRIEARGRRPEHIKISWRSWRQVQMQLIQSLRESFLWQLMWLTFYLTFGITSLISAWRLVSLLQQWSLSFGQLIPIVTLAAAVPLAYDTFHKHLHPEFAETASTLETNSNLEVGSDPEFESELESEQTSSITICLKLMGAKGYLLLILVTFVMLAWQMFLALLFGGTFFPAMEDSPPRSWIGVNVSFGLSAIALKTSQLVKASYSQLRERQIERERERERETQREREREIARGRETGRGRETQIEVYRS